MKARSYGYVGPAAIRRAVAGQRPGISVRAAAELVAWARKQDEWDADGALTLTFVVLPDGTVRVAPRRSEHVACALGGRVLAAGELTIRVEPALSQPVAEVPTPPRLVLPPLTSSTKLAVRPVQLRIRSSVRRARTPSGATRARITSSDASPRRARRAGEMTRSDAGDAGDAGAPADAHRYHETHDGRGRALRGVVTAAGETIGRYRLEQELGRGGMGVVYRAHDPLLDRPVALKIIENAGDEGDGGPADEGGEAGDSDARTARLVLHEARLAARLAHPGIVAVHDVGSHGRRAFIAMELVDGVALKQVVARDPGDRREFARRLAARWAVEVGGLHTSEDVGERVAPEPAEQRRSESRESLSEETGRSHRWRKHCHRNCKG